MDQDDLPLKKTISLVLEVASLGHLLHAFVNGEYIGNVRSDHDIFITMFVNGEHIRCFYLCI